MRDFVKNYERKTTKSKRFYSRSTKVFPGGISHNIRYFEPYPFFVNAAKGKQLPKVTDTGVLFVTKDNVATYMNEMKKELAPQ